MTQATLDKMHGMRLLGMATEFENQLSSTNLAELSFPERTGMMVDAEWTAREQRKLKRRLTDAKLRYTASIEDIDFRAHRGLDREVVRSLATGDWIRQHHGLLITGPTGIGKSYLACAFVERACRSGFTAYYVRTPRLLQDIAVARGDGSYSRLLARLAKLDLLALDDWLFNPLKDSERRDLVEVIEDRYQRRSTLVATQLPVPAWHQAIGDDTVADALCDRIVHDTYKMELKGPTMRKRHGLGKKEAAESE